MQTKAWYPCEHPERPNDAMMVWHYEGCHGCHTAAIATQRRHPGDTHVEWVVRITRPRERLSFPEFLSWESRMRLTEGPDQ